MLLHGNAVEWRAERRHPGAEVSSCERLEHAGASGLERTRSWVLHPDVRHDPGRRDRSMVYITLGHAGTHAVPLMLPFTFVHW